MPWTLYFYILRELLKVLVLTTAVMVVVLSFGAAIGPMSDGLLGPMSMVKFVLYTMPTVLGFALPFAGAFAATVVFNSMAKDNEILACRAGGLSYSRIFAPVLGLGVVLMLVLLLLSNTIVPGFWKSAKRTVEGDVLGILVSQLNQNRPYIFKDAGRVLYADAADIEEAPAGSSVDGLKAEQLIKLSGVAVGEFDKRTGHMLNDMTASAASALLIRDDFGKSYIVLRLEDPVYFDASDDGDPSSSLGQFDEFSIDQPIELPNPIEDEALFFTFNDLMWLKRNPHDFDTVRGAQADLADAVARQQLTHLIADAMARGERGTGFIKLKGGLATEYYRISAPKAQITDEGLVLLADGELKVSIDRYSKADLTGLPTKKFVAEFAQVDISTGRFDRKPEVSIRMVNVKVTTQGATGQVNEKREEIVGPMEFPEWELGVDPATLTAEQLNKWSQRETMRDAPEIIRARARLRFRIIQLKYMIDAEIHTRLSTAVATPLLLLVGTLLAVRLRDRVPLVVFFWAFVLAILTLVMIYTGQSMAERISIEDVIAGKDADRLIGVGVLWGGNLILLLVSARLYLRIARN